MVKTLIVLGIISLLFALLKAPIVLAIIIGTLLIWIGATNNK